MTLMERLTAGVIPALLQTEDPTQVPPKITARITRGRNAMKRDAPKRRLCQRFERGDSYWFLTNQGTLSFQSTAVGVNGSGKPPHRIRKKFNLLRPIIQGKVSAATRVTPSYEVVPSSLDQSRANAAKLAERVTLYGYDKWGVRQARVEAVTNAIGRGGDAFLLPYFDPNVGPYIQSAPDPETGAVRMIGTGEIKILVVNGNQCYWEPGCNFRDSPWWAIERAVPIDDIKYLPGFFGYPLTADASTSDIPTDVKASDQMILKTEYFERPCPATPQGRSMVIVNGKQACPGADYPLKNRQGQAIDNPVIHRLAWDLDGGDQRDFGLTWQLVDCIQTIQNAQNKLVEWMNRRLFPQMLVSANSKLVTRRTDEPGALNVYDGPDKPEWERVDDAPQSLFQIISSTRELMRAIAMDDSTEQQADLSNVAAKTMVADVEQALNRWQAFMAHLAEVDSQVMRHCLLLASINYTEPRLLKIRGRDGWERPEDFEGADLLDEIDVRVFPASLQPMTRQGVQDTLTWINTNWPGWLNPQDALAAYQTGTIDRLTESYFLDQARANDVVQKIRDGTVLRMPTRGTTDPTTGQPIVDPATGQPMAIPGYMPSDQDNLQIWSKVFADWMKTDDYARQPPLAQTIAQHVWDAIQRLEVTKAVRQAQLQTQMAQQNGQMNAAKPQTGATPMPSLPGSGQAPAPASLPAGPAQ